MARMDFLVSACAFFLATSVVSGQPGNSVAQKAHDILQTHCYRCHGERGAVEGGINYLLDRNQLARRGKVTPGDAGKSLLLQRILKKEMPPESEKTRPTAAEFEVLSHWI